MTSAKLKSLTKWTPLYPQLSIEEIKKSVTLFKLEGNWPVVSETKDVGSAKGEEKKKKKSLFVGIPRSFT
jgi:hypothetical protein